MFASFRQMSERLSLCRVEGRALSENNEGVRCAKMDAQSHVVSNIT